MSFLDDYGIEYVTSGHEHCTSTFPIQTNCPLAGTTNYHLGLSPTGSSCWKCGCGHSIYALLEAWTALGSNDLKKLMSKYGKGQISLSKTVLRSDRGKLLKLPLMKLAGNHRKYLTKRGFNAEKLRLKYELRSIMPIGDYGSRIYIPVIVNGKTVSFTTRTIADTKPKYIHCPDHESIVPVKDCLYGIEYCKNSHVIMTEGVTDVWKIGDDSVALFGKTLSEKQLYTTIKKFTKIFIMLDPDALPQAKKIHQKLSPYRKTLIVSLKDKDPGDLTPEEINETLKSIRRLL